MKELGPIIVHKCNICGKHFGLFEKELTHSQEEERYITCSYNGKHNDINVINKFNSIKECMENKDTYKKVKGRTRQT